MWIKFKHIVKFPINLLVYGISRACELIRRDNDKWVFGCHTGFGDNAKFFFFDVNKNHPEIHSIWIAHKRQDVNRVRQLGFEGYYWLSLKGLYHCLTAGVYIYTRVVKDINRYVSGGAFLVTLNHGVGLKKLYWTNAAFFQGEYGKPANELQESFVFKVTTYIWLYRMPNMCLVTSQNQAEEFYTKQFRIPMSWCIGGMPPRLSLFFQSQSELKAMAKKYEPAQTLSCIDKIQQYDKVYIYMPTWRNDGNDFIKSSGMDFQKLNDALKKNNALFILKLHPYTNMNLNIISGLSNIVTLDKGIDVYYILPFTDCLITDYSSIYTDYLTMKKEVILFTFDKEEYLKKCVELDNFDYYYRGSEASSFDELLSLIRSNVDCHLNETDLSDVMDLFWNYINNDLDIVKEIRKRQIKE